MVAKRISLFNHKGGVSKTTTTFNLGWMLASKGKRVVLVDADPQCNLTGMALGYKGQTELEKFYKTETSRNFHAGLAPAFESRPMLIKAVDCVPIAARSGLFLLPGHIRLAEYEVTLGLYLCSFWGGLRHDALSGTKRVLKRPCSQEKHHAYSDCMP